MLLALLSISATWSVDFKHLVQVAKICLNFERFDLRIHSLRLFWVLIRLVCWLIAIISIFSLEQLMHFFNGYFGINRCMWRCLFVESFFGLILLLLDNYGSICVYGNAWRCNPNFSMRFWLFLLMFWGSSAALLTWNCCQKTSSVLFILRQPVNCFIHVTE